MLLPINQKLDKQIFLDKKIKSKFNLFILNDV